MSQVVTLGITAKVDIGAFLVPFRVLSGQLVDETEFEETTDTDTRYGNREFFSDAFSAVQIAFAFQLDNDPSNPLVNMFAHPLRLIPGASIPLRIWPEGRNLDDDGDSAWNFVTVLLLNGTRVFGVQGSVPQGGIIKAMSNGYYKRPYEADLTSLLDQDYAIRLDDAEQMTPVSLRVVQT